MTGRNPIDNLTKSFSKERLKRIEVIKDQLCLEMALFELRQLQGLSQKELGELLGVRQPAVARMEGRSDMYVSTLRSVIEALGGELELVAKFPDKEVILSGFARSLSD
jgi:predicted XRE-type DNA-binding protein